MAQPANAAVEEAVAAPAAPAAKKRSPMGAVILTALLVGPLAVGLNSVMSSRAKTKQAAIEQWEKTAPLQEVTFPLEPITVNLVDGEKYCRLSPVLVFAFDAVDTAYYKQKLPSMKPGEGNAKSGGEGGEGGDKKKPADASIPKKVAGDAVKNFCEELPDLLPALQDATITVVSGRKYDEMLSVADKEKVKASLKEKYDEILAESKVPLKRVLFNEIIVQ